MKRKGFTVPDISILKWHSFFFVLFSVFLWMSMLTMILHPSSANVPFAAFKPLLVERMSINVLWGVGLLVHFGVRALQEMLAQRTLRLDSPHMLDVDYAELLRRSGDDNVLLMDENGRPLKRRRPARFEQGG